MSRSTARPARDASHADRLARAAERLLRLVADARLGLGLLLLAGAWNAAAAALPSGAGLLSSPPYLVLLGLILVSGMASVGVRLPPAWREWRRPAALAEGSEVLMADLPVAPPLGAVEPDTVAAVLRRSGYRVAVQRRDRTWSVAGTRRGWSRPIGQLSHLALVLMLLGAAAGRAFSHETTFSLLPGEQALLDAPHAGFTDAVRFDRFDAEVGADGRPLRLDAHVTFLRDGEPVSAQLVQVNRPGAFDGYLLHGWTYGPAVRLRVTTLGGQPLLDAPVALDGVVDGQPSAFAELPTAGLTLGLRLVDAAANELAVSAASASGSVDSATLRPGEEQRVGQLRVRLLGFDAYLTFLSRSDPAMSLLFGGAALLVACLAVALWLPRRRVTVRSVEGGMRLLLRGERFDEPDRELALLHERLASAVAVVGG